MGPELLVSKDSVVEGNDSTEMISETKAQTILKVQPIEESSKKKKKRHKKGKQAVEDEPVGDFMQFESADNVSKDKQTEPTTEIKVVDQTLEVQPVEVAETAETTADADDVKPIAEDDLVEEFSHETQMVEVLSEAYDRDSAVHMHSVRLKNKFSIEIPAEEDTSVLPTPDEPVSIVEEESLETSGSFKEGEEVFA